MSYDKSAVVEFIRKTILNNEVVLFSKGTVESPKCGFSVKAANILKLENIKFLMVDVMEMEGLREEIKEFTNWPTLPQLYVKGRFIGGADIITELYLNKTLKKELGLEEN